jgi:hypothetical protein
MKRIFRTRYFSRWMRKAKLADNTLCMAVAEMENGLIDADLGGGVVKKRIALPGRGKSGSTRTLVATNRRDRWFFLFGFEKNERANITVEELEALKGLAKQLLDRTQDQLDEAILDGSLQEVCHDQKE